MKKIISTKTASPLEIDKEKAKESWLAIAATFVIPAALVIGLLFLLISLCRNSGAFGVASKRV